MLLDADADHLVRLDSDFLRQLVGRQVVCHLAPSVSSHEKARRARCAGGLGLQLLWAQAGARHAPRLVAVELTVTQP